MKIAELDSRTTQLVGNSTLEEAWEHSADINQLAAICARWIEREKPQGRQQTAEVAKLAKQAGIFSRLRKDIQSWLQGDKFYRNALTITVDFATSAGAVVGHYEENNHTIRIFYQNAKSYGLSQAIAHELQHAIDEIRIPWHAYQGDPVKVTDLESFEKYLKDPSEINARLAEVLFTLSQQEISQEQLPKILAQLMDRNNLSPRGKFPLSDKIYKKLLSRSYKFYVNSQQIKQQHPLQVAWERLKWYAAQVAEAILGP